MNSGRANSTVQRPKTKPKAEQFLMRTRPVAKFSDGKARGSSKVLIVGHADSTGLLPKLPRNDPQRFGAPRFSVTGRKRRESFLMCTEALRTVAIVDGDDKARFILKKILERSGEYRCVGSYASGEEAIRDVPRVRPEIVLLEINLPGMSGMECMSRLKVMLPGLVVVLVSGVKKLEIMAEALAEGGDGYLAKPFAIDQFFAVLTVAIRRRNASSAESDEFTVSSARGSNESARLTGREKEVMRWVREGFFDKEIAEKLGIKFCTVRKHLRDIFPKLHAGNRTEAVRKLYGPGRA